MQKIERTRRYRRVVRNEYEIIDIPNGLEIRKILLSFNFKADDIREPHALRIKKIAVITALAEPRKELRDRFPVMPLFYLDDHHRFVARERSFGTGKYLQLMAFHVYFDASHGSFRWHLIEWKLGYIFEFCAIFTSFYERLERTARAVQRTTYTRHFEPRTTGARRECCPRDMYARKECSEASGEYALRLERIYIRSGNVFERHIDVFSGVCTDIKKSPVRIKKVMEQK